MRLISVINKFLRKFKTLKIAAEFTSKTLQRRKLWVIFKCFKIQENQESNQIMTLTFLNSQPATAEEKTV